MQQTNLGTFSLNSPPPLYQAYLPGVFISQGLNTTHYPANSVRDTTATLGGLHWTCFLTHCKDIMQELYSLRLPWTGTKFYTSHLFTVHLSRYIVMILTYGYISTKPITVSHSGPEAESESLPCGELCIERRLLYSRADTNNVTLTNLHSVCSMVY